MEKVTEKEDPRLVEIRKTHAGKITTFIVPLDQDEDEGDPDRKLATFYLKNCDKPTRLIMMKLSGSQNPERAVIAGLKALRLGGDEVSVIENNYDALISAENAMLKHITVKETIIKKN